MTERFDAVVIGGGMSGLPLALRAAKHGTVALIEKELLGGTCLNRGCIPTKTMIASADVAHSARTAATFGITLPEPVVDLGAIVDRKDDVVGSIRKGSYRAVEKRDGLDFIEGTARFVADHTIDVDGRRIHADKIFLNTGTRVALGGIEGLDTVPHLTSRTILDLRDLPEHLIVVGGGFIGCEFAQMFRRFGSQVTVVQRGDRLIPSEDVEISAAVQEGFDADGINVLTSTSCTRAGGTAGDIRIGCRGDNRDEIAGTHLLVATGRVPNSDRLGLEHLGIEPGPAGFLSVDEKLRSTQAEDVWVLGDLRGGAMFTHTARDDADTVYRNTYRDSDRSVADRIVPHAVFVDPEVGSVGLTEQQARDAGYDVAVGVQRFDGVAKARAMDKTIGLIKFVVDHATDRILGCHIAGPHGGDLVHEAALAMVTGATYSDIGAMIHVHPTLAEGINSAAGGVHRPSSE
jgi:pyruvate/2-oxoglutarate dehydrogenase complex dihydrolipoamide dehydrogenase (E3) component